MVGTSAVTAAEFARVYSFIQCHSSEALVPHVSRVNYFAFLLCVNYFAKIPASLLDYSSRYLKRCVFHIRLVSLFSKIFRFFRDCLLPKASPSAFFALKEKKNYDENHPINGKISQ